MGITNKISKFEKKLHKKQSTNKSKHKSKQNVSKDISNQIYVNSLVIPVINNEYDNIIIDIGISCIKGSEEFAYLCLSTLIRLANNPKRLKFYLGIDLNQSSNTDGLRLKKIRELVPDIDIDIITTGYSRSSISHGVIINKLYSKFTNKYAIISDNDILIYQQNWDNLFLENMIQNDLAILGVPYDDDKNKHYTNFPCAMFCMFDREKLLPLNIDFHPIGWNAINHKPLIVDNIKYDTGIELYLKITKTDMKYKILVSDKTHKTEGNINSYYYFNDQLIMSHYQRGTQEIQKTHKYINLWIRQMIKYCKKMHNIDLKNLKHVFDDFL